MNTYLRMSVIVALVSLVLGALLGCASGTPASPTATPKPAPATAAPAPAASTPAVNAPAGTAAPVSAPTAPAIPQPTGELRVGLSTFGSNVNDPANANGTAGRNIGAAIFDYLVGISQDGRPAPGIAEKWEMAADGKTWTFSIRKGVKFHDGSDLTAADVHFTLQRVLASEALGSYAASLRGVADKIEVKDDYTVVLSLKKPDPEIWKWLSPFGGGEGLIVPKKYISEKGVEAFRGNMIGSGPFKLVKYDNNVEARLEAVPNHWRAKAQWKTISIKNIPEESTRLAMLKTNQLDLIEIMPEKAAEVKSAGLSVISIDAPQQANFVLFQDFANPKGTPMNDVRVRQALSMAVNRQEMAEKLFSGYARPGVLGLLSTVSPYFDPSVMKQDAYDPTQAKALLSQAGFASGFPTKIISDGSTTWMNVFAEALAGYWDKIGLKTTVINMDRAALRGLYTPAVKPELIGAALTQSVQPYPYYALRTSFHSVSSTYHMIRNSDLDASIEKTEATMDPAERKKLALQSALMAKDEYVQPAVVEVYALLAGAKTIGQWTPAKGAVALGLEYEKIPHGQ